MGVRIERAVTTDSEMLTRLRVAFYQEQSDLGMKNAPIDIPAFAADSTPKLLGSRFSSVFLAAEGAGPAFGYILGQMRISPAQYKHPTVGFIQELYVEPDHRRRGAAQSLCEALKECFRQQGVTWLELQVLASNHAGQRFWEGQGFKPRLIMMDAAAD